MSGLFTRLLGVNWKTTLAGITAIIAAVSRIAVAYRTRDFQAIFSDGQLIIETVGALIIGLGLMTAKDQNVTGTGTMAKALDEGSGKFTNREGEVVGKQPAG